MNNIVKVLIALVLSYGMLQVAKLNSRGRPEHFQQFQKGYNWEMVSVPKGEENATERITVSVDPLPASVIFRRADKGIDNTEDQSSYSSVAMTADPNQAGTYYIDVTAGVKNGRFYYYYQAVDTDGNVLSDFKDPIGESFFFRYIGHVPIYILGPHILFIVATFFTVMMAVVNALPLISGKSTETYPVAKWLFWSVVAIFMGGYPFGIPMNWYAFGGLWEGVPFGTDATDNKTQLLLVYLLFAWLACYRSFTHGKSGRDIFSPKGTGWLGISALFVSLAIYLIPHSIQFSAGLTYSVCYGFIGLSTLLYFIGYSRASRN